MTHYLKKKFANPNFSEKCLCICIQPTSYTASSQNDAATTMLCGGVVVCHEVHLLPYVCRHWTKKEQPHVKCYIF